MKLLPFIFTGILLSGCQSLAIREPVIKPAEILRQPQFTVPHRAARRLKAGEEYEVVLSILINKSGQISSISVTESSGVVSLDLRALRDARKMIFKAGTKDNEFITTKVTVPITYVIH